MSLYIGSGLWYRMVSQTGFLRVFDSFLLCFFYPIVALLYMIPAFQGSARLRIVKL